MSRNRKHIECLRLSLSSVASTVISVKESSRVLRSSLHTNSLYLMVNSGVNAGSGFIFWIVAARLYSTEDVGIGSALISAATLLAFISSLGLDYGLVRFLPSARERRQELINSSLTLVTLASAIAGSIFLVGIPLWSRAFLAVRDNPVFMGTFIAFVVAWGFYSIMANIFVSFRRAKFTLANGVIYNVSRVACVVALAIMLGPSGIFVSWGIAAVVASGVGFLWFLPRLLPGYHPMVTLRRQVTNDMLHFSLANYVSNSLWYAPQLLLPILLVNLLGATANAFFFIAWSVAGLLLAIPMATSASLFAEGSYQPESVRRDLMRSLKLTVVLILPAVVLLLALGEKVLMFFGGEYAAGATSLMWLLVAAALPASINLLYIGTARVQKRFRDILLVTGCVAIGTLIPSYFLLPHLGILGAGVAWLATHSLIATALITKLRKENQI